MLVFLLRIAFPAALLYVLKLARDNARVAPDAGDLTNAFYVALSVLLAMGLAVVWAPFVGGRLADPLTGVYTEGHYVERKKYLLRLVRWLDGRGWRRLTVLGCFLEGVNHPWLPTAFVIGMRNARLGSWLEKVYAKEVFKFDNAQHCMQACDALRRHGIDPLPHHRPDVNLLLRGRERTVNPEPEPIAVPAAPPRPPPNRNPRLRLFDAADDQAAEKPSPDPPVEGPESEPEARAEMSSYTETDTTESSPLSNAATSETHKLRPWTSAGPR